MLTLAVIGLTDVAWNMIGPRLRGAALEADSAACDAILCQTDANAMRSLQSDVHVLLLADDALTRHVSELKSQSGKRFAIVNPDRYLPSRQLIRQQLDAGKLGELGLIRIHRWEPAELLVRDLDLTLWYFGTAPNVVRAVENAACKQVHLGFPGGGMALIDHAKALPEGDRYYSLSLIGSSGAAYADDHANLQLLYQGGSPRAIRSEEDVVQWTALLQEFVDSVAHDSNRAIHARGSESYPTWADVFTIRDAIAKSLKSKQTVDLAPLAACGPR